jgi:enoyl-CoA hydratase
MPDKKVRYEAKDGIGWITINNPEKMNILDFDVYDGLFSALKSIEDDEHVRVVILTAEGDKAFICGQDINTFRASTHHDAKKVVRTCLELFTGLESLSKPVIAAVNGLALGGGTEVVLACDIVVASENARFGLPESGIGTTPIWGLIRLAGAVGKYKAKELMMTGDVITSQEAKEIGLVNKVVPHEKLLDEAKGIAHKIMAKAPLAIEAIKSSLNRDVLPEGVPLTSTAGLFFFQTDDFKEGIESFLKKRKPVFRGG